MPRSSMILSIGTAVVLAATPSVAQATTVKQYADQADAVCTDFGRKAKALDQNPQTVKELIAYLKATRQVLGTTVTKLNTIPLPDHRRRTVLRLRRLDNQDLRTLKAYIAKLDGGAKLRPATNSFARALGRNDQLENAAWKSLGALGCAAL